MWFGTKKKTIVDIKALTFKDVGPFGFRFLLSVYRFFYIPSNEWLLEKVVLFKSDNPI